MALNDEQRLTLTAAAEQILGALELIAKEARNRLATTATRSPADVLGVRTNLMAHAEQEGKRSLDATFSTIREQLLRISQEPFIARVTVMWEGSSSPQTIYFSRPSAADVADAIPGARVVTYGASLGRLAEVDAGESATIRIPSGVRTARIEERVRLRPMLLEGEWDAVDDTFEFGPWSIALESIREFLSETDRISPEDDIPDVLGALLQQGAQAMVLREKLKRRVVDRISLRDQPILDRYQGEVFRMPVDTRRLRAWRRTKSLLASRRMESPLTWRWMEKRPVQMR